MKYRLEHWQAVWERCIAVVDIPDGVDPEEWAYDHVDEWIPDAICNNDVIVGDTDSEITVEKIG